MKFTKFFKLRHAISNLDYHFIANKIAELEDRLSSNGMKLDPANTAITHEGIFYINPESGMATRVVLYDSDQRMLLNKLPKTKHMDEGFTKNEEINKLHKYHLICCNVLTDVQKKGWGTGYRIAQRFMPSFYYRILKNKVEEPTAQDIYVEIDNQRLEMCQNCFLKINSLLDGVEDLKRESFQLEYFFDFEFFGSWCRYGEFSNEDGALSGMYPKDWEEICRIRKEQVQYHCELCQQEFSNPKDHDFLYVHPTDHVKKKVPYVKLQCLCMGCLSELPDRSYLKELPEYAEFAQKFELSSQ